MSYSYVIFAGETKDTLQPQKAAPTEPLAIAEAKLLQEKFSCVEAVFMPEDNLDINEIVYSNYK